VAGELCQDLAEMPFAEDQHVVQALAAQRAHEPLRVGVGHRRELPRRPTGRHRVHVDEVDHDDAAGLGGQELRKPSSPSRRNPVIEPHTLISPLRPSSCCPAGAHRPHT
jgi:hypothetical protein